MQYIVHVTVLYSVKLIYSLVFLDCGLQCMNGYFNGECTGCECDEPWIGANCDSKGKVKNLFLAYGCTFEENDFSCTQLKF